MPGESAFEPDMGAQLRSRGGKRAQPHTQVDALIADLAGGQYGVVSRAQLLKLGLTRRVIGHRLECGRLRPVHRAVYAAGHSALSIRGRWMAAVLAAGEGAVLSHGSAAALWRIQPFDPRVVEVSATTSSRSRPGLTVHRARLRPNEVTIELGIPVTTPARTLLDIASGLREALLLRAVNEARAHRLVDDRSLDAVLKRHTGHRGAGALGRALAAERAGAGITRSELEDRFLELVARAGLPRPETNAHLRVAGRWLEVDRVWRRARLIVELDSRAFHSTPAAFGRDRTRDRALHADDWTVLRVTWRQLHDDAAALLADLRSLLSRRGRRTAAG